MKCKLQDQILLQLKKDNRFLYMGNTNTWFFESLPYPNNLSLKKLSGDKDCSKVKIMIFSPRFEIEEVEFKVEMLISGDWEIFFQGWSENIEEFNIILKSIGL